MFTRIVDWIIVAVSLTFGEWHWPWVDKKFPLSHYFQIESELRKLNVPFAVGLVRTNGHGSNVLIKIAQIIGRDKRKSKAAHVLAHIGLYKGYKHRVVESVGDGLREISLLEAIGARDNVMIRVPNPKYISDDVCLFAIEHLKRLAALDEITPIKYDNKHNYKDTTQLDCSETILTALEYGFEKTGQVSPIKLIKRGTKLSWVPVDIEYSPLFTTIYDSEEGFLS